jgi:hypothetical protein
MSRGVALDKSEGAVKNKIWLSMPGHRNVVGNRGETERPLMFLFSSGPSCWGASALLRRRELPVYPYFLPDSPGPAPAKGNAGSRRAEIVALRPETGAVMVLATDLRYLFLFPSDTFLFQKNRGQNDRCLTVLLAIRTGGRPFPCFFCHSPSLSIARWRERGSKG